MGATALNTIMSIEDASTWPEYSRYDPEFNEIAGGSLPSIDLSDITIARRRSLQMTQRLIARSRLDYNDIKKSAIQIPMSDGASIRSILYQPESPASSGSPLVMLFHPGGFCVGSPEMEEPFALDLVRIYSAVVLSVDYRKAPEHVFPRAMLDSFDAIRWAAENAAFLDANPSKGFIVGGTSSGGSISAVVSHMARDENLSPPLTGVWLNLSNLIAQSAMPTKYRNDHTSFQQNQDAPLINTSHVDLTYTYFKPDDTDPRFSPLLWPGGHKGLPPHLIQCAGLDFFRDDSLLYTRELKEQGVPVTTHVYPGVPHAFDTFFPDLMMTQKFHRDRHEWFTDQLGDSWFKMTAES